MADTKTTIEQMKEQIRLFAWQRNWQQFHSPKNLAMGIAIEAGELMEHFQWIDESASRAIQEDPQQIARVRDELADVLSYVLNLACVLELDLSDAFCEKMKRNQKKYPAMKYYGRFKL
jgi:dCTP diphosphatase